MLSRSLYRTLAAARPVPKPAVAAFAAQVRFNSHLPYIPESEPALTGNYENGKKEFYGLRDPYKKYTNRQQRRDFGEPVHENYDVLHVWSPDVYDVVPDKTALKYLGTFFASAAVFSLFIYYFFYPEHPGIRRNYPYGGLAKALGATSDEEAALLAARVDSGDEE